MTERLGQHTYSEIQSQPRAWQTALRDIRAQAGALAEFWRTGRYEQIIFTGCGSPYYIALSAAAHARVMGLEAQAVPASEVWLNPASAFPRKRTLLVALSRSGATTEVLQACEAFAADGAGDVLTLSCYPDAPLATAGKLNVLLAAGQEESFAQTRAFTTLLLGAVACGAVWSGNTALLDELDKLSGVCARVLEANAGLARVRGSDPAIDRYYFLGSGPRYGLASEMSLKMKEMSLSHSEPFHFLEFRHGPQTMVTQTTLVVGLVSENNAGRELAVLDDVRSLGGKVMAIGESGCDANFASGLSELARSALYVVVGQMLAYEHAISKGLNPDRPHNLHAVVKL